jgi:hypothetical protein
VEPISSINRKLGPNDPLKLMPFCARYARLMRIVEEVVEVDEKKPTYVIG